MYFITLFFLLGLFIPVAIFIAAGEIKGFNNARYKKIKKERKKKKLKFQEKYPFEYSLKEKRWSYVVVFVITLWFMINFKLILLEEYEFLVLVMFPLGFLLWRFLVVKMGNKL